MLRSLWECERPPVDTEVLLILNSSKTDSEAIRQANRQTYHQAVEWIEAHQDTSLQYHLLNFPDLPPKHAGVGLARKIGMDEAAARFHHCDRLDQGVIICFDADCRCAPNFLVAYARHFAKNPEIAGCSTYFEHPLEGPEQPALYEAAAAYELHLRYHIEALRYIKFPFAHHTVGSSMAVRALTYLRLGGMNRRKAGEDFYFFQKLMMNAPISELTTTTVYPSVRPSHRVPFGTGKAINQILSGEPQTTYPFLAYLDLQMLVTAVQTLTEVPVAGDASFLAPLPSPLAQFLQANDYEEALGEIAENVGDIVQFNKRFWHWFNGFRCMKFLNWVVTSHYRRVPVIKGAAEPCLLERIGNHNQHEHSVPELLRLYRKKQTMRQ
ncbi:MAG: hypothetical protein M2R45_02441 [Verrucomicrobia subdivision 3 bacterium]|nr:hypothetical protein [Limisphaerales bacterium]MCS1416354.1 hypothetical protein [Limisphaerales bacterium]